MKMALDLAASDGFGYCAELLPEVLTRNEWGFPIVGEDEVPSHASGRRQTSREVLPAAITDLDPIEPRRDHETNPAEWRVRLTRQDR